MALLENKIYMKRRWKVYIDDMASSFRIYSYPRPVSYSGSSASEYSKLTSTPHKLHRIVN